MRAVVWVQHLLGTGHTVRAVAIARALAARGVAVTLVLGGQPPATLDLSGLEVLALTPVAATDGSFLQILGADGTPYADLAEVRAARFAEAVAGADIVLTETFPLGRRPFAGEVLRALQRAPAGAVIAASVRDVLVRKSPAKEARMAELARNHYGLVLVHADPAFVRLSDSFGAAAAIEPLVRYTGYVHSPAAAADGTDGSGEIVVSCGGGDVGANLVAASLDAAATLAAGPAWRILVPGGLAEQLAAWRAAAPPHVVVEPNRTDFRSLLSRAALSVSQAGYNTVLDVLAAGVRAVFVPFAAFGETEQSERAAALEARGLALCLAEASLTGDTLARAVTTTLAAPAPVRPALRLDGAERSAEILIDAAHRRAA